MRIVTIRETSVALSGGVANAVVSFEGHRVSLVGVVSDVVRDGRPLVGVAFNSIGRHAQGGILRDRMIPRLLAVDPDDLLDPATGLLDPAAVLARAMTGEKPGGHGDRAGAAAALELACWDLLAKYHDEPAHRTIARAFDRPPQACAVPVYAAGGYYRGDPAQDLAALQEELRGYRGLGYEAVKIKVGGRDLADDLQRIEAAIAVMGSGRAVAVDANGRLDREQALACARVIEPYGLRWFEEPVDPLDLSSTQELTASYAGALATGENLFSVQDVVNLLRHGGPRPGTDVLQMDAGLSYGLTEYARMIARMQDHRFPRSAAVPHGGHLINLHLVVGLGLGGCEAYPGVFEPFGGYSDGCVLADGAISPADDPGFGLEAKAGLAGPIAGLVAP